MLSLSLTPSDCAPLPAVQAQYAISSMGLPVLLSVLTEDRDDLELLKGALEVLQHSVALPDGADAGALQQLQEQNEVRCSADGRTARTPRAPFAVAARPAAAQGRAPAAAPLSTCHAPLTLLRVARASREGSGAFTQGLLVTGPC